MSEIRFEGHSDDQAYITGINIFELTLIDLWLPLVVDGRPVAEVKLEWEGDWITTIRPLPHVSIEVEASVICGDCRGTGRFESRGQCPECDGLGTLNICPVCRGTGTDPGWDEPCRECSENKDEQEGES